MSFTDRLSTLVGAPPHYWKETEKTQMKNVQKCYKIAYSGNHDQRFEYESVGTNEDVIMVEKEVAEQDEMEGDDKREDRMKVAEAVKDEENYLPENSPLRSKTGEMKQPANATFRDFDTFVKSCSMDYWQNYFDRSAGDQLMVETARTILSSICVVQSKNQLRVQKGHVPFRKRREHITPLALAMHEIKDWCVTFLRTANPDVEDTFKEIKNRIVYFEGLAQKEVWGNPAISFGSGIRSTGHHNMFRTLSTAKNLLEKAEAYSYRKFCGRSSREKLKDLTRVIQQLINREIRVFSGRFQLEKKLGDPKTPKLNPALLLQGVEDMQQVDFKNPVNVLLFKIFQNDFVRACFNSHFEDEGVQEIIKQLGSWSDGNLFCRKGVNEPIFLMENEKGARMMPQVYKPTASELKTKLRQVDTRTPVPDSAKKVAQRLKSALQKDEIVAEIIRNVMKCLAAVQDLIPSLYAVHKLYELAGEGGNFTIYDNMRENVLRLMEDTIKRTKTLRSASRHLGRSISKRAAIKEAEIKKERIKTGKVISKPNWVHNHRYISVQMEQKSAKSYSQTLKLLVDIAKTARDYTLTSDQLNDKVNAAKTMLDQFTGFNGGNYSAEADLDNVEEVGVPLNTKKNDKDSYIASKSPVMDDSDDESEFAFGANNNFGTASSAKKSRRPVMNYDSDESD